MTNRLTGAYQGYPWGFFYERTKNKMAVATVNDVIAGILPGVDISKASFTAEAAGVLHSSFYLAGLPGAAVAPTPGLAGAALTSYAGQITFPSSSVGKSIYLARMEVCQSGNIGGITLYDRLWHNSGFTATTTGAQTVSSVTFPARDRTGATNGDDVMIGLEVSAATTNGSAITNMTASYTNSAGTSGRTATVQSFPATAALGSFIPFNLAAGDAGVRSVQSVSFGTSLVTGTVHLVAYREIVGLGCPLANVMNTAGVVDLAVPIMYDNSVPFLVYNMVGTAGGVVNAKLKYTQG